MKDIDDFDGFGVYSIHDSVRTLDQLTDVGLIVTIHHPTKIWILSQSVATLQDGIDCPVGSVLRIG